MPGSNVLLGWLQHYDALARYAGLLSARLLSNLTRLAQSQSRAGPRRIIVCESVLYVVAGDLSDVVYSVEEWPWQAESCQFTIIGVANCAYAVARKQEVRVG